MLIQDFVQVPRPQAQVREEMLGNAVTFLGRLADAAYRDGEQLSIRLTPSLKLPRVGKRVHVDVGDAYEVGDRLIVPIHWWASGLAAVFPRLDGDLEVAPLGAGATQISLMGRYEPPLAALGRGADRLLMHRVAEGCVRSFLTRLAAAVTGGALAAVAV